jgi:uncharacterized protein
VIIKNSIIIILLLFIPLFLISCGRNYTPEQKKYIAKIEKERAQKDSDMKNDPASPFNVDSNAHYQPLKYYPVNPDYVFHSRLYRFYNMDTIDIYGTKGEARKVVRFGYVKFNFKGKEYKVNVYEGWSKAGDKYYSIWFTDKTTGDETYGVGRYIDFDLNPDSDFVYTIDFNEAYNPYCSYSAKYSCAIPTKEDHLDFAVEAGEKKFHN